MGNKTSSPPTREDTPPSRRNTTPSYPTEESAANRSSLSRSRRGNSSVAGTGRTTSSISSTSPTDQRADRYASNDDNGGSSVATNAESRDYQAANRNQGQEVRPVELSWYQMAKVGYQELVNAIIRPPRAQYSVSVLGPVEFNFLGNAFKRIDFRLLNERGHVLECSHWRPHGWRRAEQLPCIVYMHGNSSARPEAIPQLSLALSLGATLVAFDFAGSGRSGGDHVSLGYYERDDLKAVVEHLRKSGEVGAIALWGRSMGAATALLHGDRDMSIAALVLDSAFADLTQLAEEMVERGREAGLTVPSFVVKMMLRMIRGSVSKTAGFNVRDLCPIAHADRTFIPALFIAGRGDDFIRPQHSQQIHDAYAGDKNIVLVEGDHNSPRPKFLYDSVYIFLQTYLQVPAEWSLDRGDVLMGLPPWHHACSTGGGGGGAFFRARRADPGADLTDFVDWDGVALEDVGVDGAPGMGMTAASQAEFQTALFHMLAQERNESSAPTEDIDNRRPPQNAVVAPVLTVAAPPRVNKRRISRRAKSFDSASPCAQTFTGDARSRNDDTSLPVLEKESGGANDAGIGLDRSEDEAGVAAVAAIANAARAARASAAAGEMAAGKGATGEEEGGGELSALRGFATPSAVGRPAMAPYSVSDTSEFWDLEENTISPDEGNSIQKTGAGYSTVGAGDSTATPRAGQPGLGRGGQHDGEAAPVGEDGGTTDGVAQLVLDPDEEDSFASQDSGFGTVAVNGEMTRDTKGPSPESDNERRRLSGASGNGLGWRGKLESTSGGAVEISDGARPVNGSGEWSCKLCTLINTPAANECLACGAPRTIG